MEKDMDKIQFDDRREIENIMEAISKYVNQNPEERNNKTLKRFYSLLDLMDMEW